MKKAAAIVSDGLHSHSAVVTQAAVLRWAPDSGRPSVAAGAPASSPAALRTAASADRSAWLPALCVCPARIACALLWRSCFDNDSILPQRLHLLLAIHQKRFDLRLLVRAQIQRFRQVRELPVRIHRAPVMPMTPLALLLTAGGRCLLLRVESGLRAKREHSAECNCEIVCVSLAFFCPSSCCCFQPAPMRRVARRVALHSYANRRGLFRSGCASGKN